MPRSTDAQDTKDEDPEKDEAVGMAWLWVL
jgi:hypothetical protein